jgi:predicted PurR-regulated permease PerM
MSIRVLIGNEVGGYLALQSTRGNGGAIEGGTRPRRARSSAAMVAKPDVPAENETPPELRELRAIRVLLTGLFLIALFGTFYFARALLLPIVLALIVALTLRPVVRGLQKLHVPAPVSAVGLIAGLGALIAFGAWWAAGPARRLVERAPEIGREVRWKLRDLIASISEMQQATEEVENLASGGGGQAREVVLEQGGLVTNVVGSLTGAGTSIVVALILATFLLASWDFFISRIVEEAPRFRDKKRAMVIVRDLEKQISRYLAAITMINAGLGVSIGLALWAVGLPNPHLWGIAAFLLNFLPFLGAIAGTIGVTMVAIVTFDTVGQALLAPLAYYTLTSLEGQIVTPLLLGRHLAINTVAVFVTVMLWVWLWGIAGAFLAVPVLVIVKVLADNLPAMNRFGRFLEGRTRD